MNFLSHSTSIIGDSSTALRFAQNDKINVMQQCSCHFERIRNPHKIISLWGLKKVRFCVHFIKLIYLFLKIVYAIIATRVEVFWFLFTWWRSGNNGNYNNAYVMAPSGVNDNNHNVTNAYGVRPALHSLTKWCKFSCIWQIAGKKLLRFANWLIWVWRDLLSCLYFFKRRNKLDLSTTAFLLWNVLKKVVELFFYLSRKKAILRGTKLVLCWIYKVIFVLLNNHIVRDPSTRLGMTYENTISLKVGDCIGANYLLK